MNNGYVISAGIGLTLVAGHVWVPPAAHAQEVYRCAQADGRMGYQDRPCSAGLERPGDTPWDRARKAEVQRTEQTKRRDDELVQKALAEAENRAEQKKGEIKQAEGLRRKNVEEMRDCKVAEIVCNFDEVRWKLQALSREEVTQGFGPPTQVQKLSTMELWYYTIKLQDNDGVKFRRVQIAFEYGIDPVTGRGTFMVKTVSAH